MLPPDKKLKILGIPNRIFLAVSNSIFCVIVEIWLNAIGALTWDWSFWSAKSPVPILLFGYLHFFLVSYWVHDMKTIPAKAITVGVIFGVAIFGLVVFGSLGWI
jgi:hypothetical protein